MSVHAMKVQLFRNDALPLCSSPEQRLSKTFCLLVLFIFISVCCMVFFISSVKAEDVPPEMRGSGLPLPRFVSISSEKAYVRSGPAPRYPIKWVYKKDGLPVEIIQEFDVWRKVRDNAGDEGWINKALLSDRRSVIIRGDQIVDMREDAAASSRVMAQLEPGVIARLQKCDSGWCRLSVGGFEGWVERKALWGVYPQETIE